MQDRKSKRRLTHLAAAWMLLAPLGATAQTETDFGILVMAHGGGAEWDAGVLDTVEPLRERYPLEVAFGMADAVSLQEAVDRLEARGVDDIAVVRLFISGESWHERTRQIFGLEEGAPARPATQVDGHAHAESHAQGHDYGVAAPQGQEHGHGAAHAQEHRHDTGQLHAQTHNDDSVPDHGVGHGAELTANRGAELAAGQAHHGYSMAFWRLDSDARFRISSDGLADAAEMSEVLLSRARNLSVDPAAEDVLILAHGPETDEENARWIAKMKVLAAPLAELGFHSIEAATLREDWPDKREVSEQTIRGFVTASNAAGHRTLVIPFRVHGFGPYARVLEGLDYAADGSGLIPHPAVAAWIERQALALRGK